MLIQISQRIALLALTIAISAPAALANETVSTDVSDVSDVSTGADGMELPDAQTTVTQPVAQPLEQPVAQAEEQPLDLLTQRLEAAVQSQIAEDSEAAKRSESAMLELTESLVGSAEVESEEVQTVEGLIVENEPSAEALSGLASVSLATADEETTAGLVASLDSENELTALYAADALWTVTQDSDLVLPTLISASTSDDIQVQALAIEALTRLGKEALPAVPVLDRLAGDDRAGAIARDALSLIRSDNRPATALGIVAREARRLNIIPTVIRSLIRLW